MMKKCFTDNILLDVLYLINYATQVNYVGFGIFFLFESSEDLCYNLQVVQEDLVSLQILYDPSVLSLHGHPHLPYLLLVLAVP